VKFSPRTTSIVASACSILAGTVLVAPMAQASTKAHVAATPTSHRGAARSAHFVPAVYSIRLEDQLLAVLRYLPVTFKPAPLKSTKKPPTSTTTVVTTTTSVPTTTTTSASTTSTSTTTVAPTTTTTIKPRTPSLRTNKILGGTFVWRFNAITTLRPQWRVGTDNVVLHGAVMHFQSVHGLATSGEMDTPTWLTLQHAALSAQFNPAAYSYVVVTQSLPQHLDLYVNGKHTYTSLVNTGISVAPTENGTYPVYLRYVTTTMSGTLPNGKHYSDSGIPWTSYFHGGDALHGFIRSSYGWPQSLGCVEMPFANAAKVWPYTPIGTLVTVR